MSFFGQPSNEYDRKQARISILKNQVVLNKVGHISLSDSDRLNGSDFRACFDALEEIAKAESDAIRKSQQV